MPFLGDVFIQQETDFRKEIYAFYFKSSPKQHFLVVNLYEKETKCCYF